jgi:hypothetical protein
MVWFFSPHPHRRVQLAKVVEELTAQLQTKEKEMQDFQVIVAINTLIIPLPTSLASQDVGPATF